MERVIVRYCIASLGPVDAEDGSVRMPMFYPSLVTEDASYWPTLPEYLRPRQYVNECLRRDMQQMNVMSLRGSVCKEIIELVQMWDEIEVDRVDGGVMDVLNN